MTRIAYVMNGRFPTEKAHGHQTAAMSSAWQALGDDVTVCVPDRVGVSAEDPYAYYRVAPACRVDRVPCIDLLAQTWMAKPAFLLEHATFLYNLVKRLRVLAPDVVYSRDLDVFTRGDFPGKRIWEVHAVPLDAVSRRALFRTDGIVALTQAMRDRLVAMGYPAERVCVEPDAVDPNLFNGLPDRQAARQALGIPDGAFMCLYVGKFLTMGASKGLDESLLAAAALRTEGMDVRVVAVGGTAVELEQYRSKVGPSDLLIGHQRQDTLKNYYAAADALLMPFPWTEHYAYYMSPLKLFEYLQSGIPIVASDLPSVREIVDESQAFLCEPGNVASLAHQLARIRQEPEEAAKRAASAKVLAASYTWSARVERIRAWVDALPAWPERERQAALLARRDLLLVTQALDEQDQVLSFFVDWVRGLATKGFLIRAICWKKGQVLRLPANVVVTQAPAGAFRRSWFLVKLSWQQRAWVKAAFVHMLAPVVVALGAWWRMLGIRVSLWYTHGSVPWTLRVANWFATDIFTATEDSCRLATAKKHVLGHGINLEAFLVGTETREPMLLTVGRIAPRKDQLALVRLAEELQKEMGMRPWRIIIVGRPALPSDRAYEQEVRLAIERAGLTDRVLLVGEKKGPELLALYQRAALFVNPSRTGSLDKVVLEALACGTPALVVGTSYDGFAGVQRVDDVAIAAGVQRAVAALERPQAMPEARHGVHERANLDGLIDRLGARMMA